MKKFAKKGLFVIGVLSLVFSACRVSTPVVDPIPAAEPEITKQPVGATYYVGDTATALEVEATISDDGELSYYWYEDGKDSIVHEGRTFVPPTNTEGKFEYYCVVENYNCNCPSDYDTAEIESNLAVINVLKKEIEAAEPKVTVTLGNAEYEVETENAVVKVSAVITEEIGKGTLSYQWYTVSGGAAKIITGQTSSTCKVDTSVAGDFVYYCVVTNTFAGKQKSVNSDEITIKITPKKLIDAVKPVVTSTSNSASYMQGDVATALEVSATVSDEGSLSYQWMKVVEGVESEIAGETSTSYTPSTTELGTVEYYCVVTNTNDAATGVKTATESSAKFTILVSEIVVVNAETPVITTDLISAEYDKYATAATLVVEATITDGGELSYVWYKNGVVMAEVTTNSYTPSTEVVSEDNYTCEITNTNNAVNGLKTAKVTSATATINVKPINNGQVETPVISIVKGTVTITCSDSDADIYYTTGGETPDVANVATTTKYVTSFSVSPQTTVKAIATKGEDFTDSEVASVLYEIPTTKVTVTPTNDWVSATNTDGIWYATSIFAEILDASGNHVEWIKCWRPTKIVDGEEVTDKTSQDIWAYIPEGTASFKIVRTIYGTTTPDWDNLESKTAENLGRIVNTSATISYSSSKTEYSCTFVDYPIEATDVTITYTATNSWDVWNQTTIFACCYDSSDVKTWVKCSKVSSNEKAMTFVMPAGTSYFRMARAYYGSTNPSWTQEGDATNRIYNRSHKVTYVEGTTSYTGEFVDYTPGELN